MEKSRGKIEEYVDMLQLHKLSFSKIPLIDVYKEIQKLVSLGKVKYIGISNVSLEHNYR